MKKNNIILLLVLIVQINGDVIFFDLGDTLIKIEQSKVNKHIGFKNIVSELLRLEFSQLYHFNFSANPKKHFINIFFKGLNAIKYELPVSVDYEMYSNDGVTPLPHFMRDTMLGYFTYQTAKPLCDTMLQENPKLFGSENQKTIFLNMFELAFNPHVFASTQTATKLTKTLAQCAKKVDENGNKKHVCIILSNWTKDNIPLFKKQFAQEIMTYIDDCVFSCDGFGGKPGKNIYQYCYDLVKMQYPDQMTKPWFFLDDQKINGDGFKAFIESIDNRIKPILFWAHPKQAHTLLKKHGVIN